MNAHLRREDGTTVVQVPDTPDTPRIVEHAGSMYALVDPGFPYWGGPAIGAYVEYYQADPARV